MAVLSGFSQDYNLIGVSYAEKRVNGGSDGSAPGYVTAADLNQIKAALSSNNYALDQYSGEVKNAVTALDDRLTSHNLSAQYVLLSDDEFTSLANLLKNILVDNADGQ